jgi:hypothetical protein
MLLFDVVLFIKNSERNLKEFRKSLLKTSEDIMFHKETATIFGDPLTITLEDPNHSKDNNRAIESGLSRQERFGLSLYRLLDPGRD